MLADALAELAKLKKRVRGRAAAAGGGGGERRVRSRSKCGSPSLFLSKYVNVNFRRETATF